ncbi:MAG: type II toxin-antitoxin system VapC family toxin [Verrucomicrobiales bacterium]
MIGLDTNVLVARVIPEHPKHEWVTQRLAGLTAEGRHFAVTSVILSEFVHVVTDPKRFEKPLTMGEALHWAKFWSRTREVKLLALDAAAHMQWLTWLGAYKLGRKRLIDTLIAATWHTAGVREMITFNPEDFKVLGVFEILE